MFGQPFQREHLRRVGYLPEQPGLYRKMKVLAQLTFLGELRGFGSAVLRARERRSGANGWRSAVRSMTKYEELSKGMQQKIQFIAAVMHDPEFLIMDEPFSGLDPVNAKLLKDILLEMKRQGQDDPVLQPSHGPGGEDCATTSAW